ncbi:Ectoine hydroxylase [Mizuhopecten yessoensis]|uniref:Ectoine hydroxylase n=1 Tax=Mizuhopecten yessoensis TaxID=6573 RepID=A0A210PUI9_MIZYE|nr:Ectoine hydroxylase [Mizuhopecten yessoensis]
MCELFSILSHSVYQYSKDFRVTDQVRQEFDQHGYIVLKGVLDKEEVSLVEKTIGGSDAITKHKFGDFVDGGRKTDTVLWKHPGNDVTGMVSRSEKVAGIAEQLLGGEVYHYHTKLMLKEGGRGAKHAWHQDYSYWYWNGCLFPDMLTVFIPLDDCRKENSCLQILRGSHKCGRIHHKTVGEQNGCDVERIEELKEMPSFSIVTSYTAVVKTTAIKGGGLSSRPTTERLTTLPKYTITLSIPRSRRFRILQSRSART